MKRSTRATIVLLIMQLLFSVGGRAQSGKPQPAGKDQTPQAANTTVIGGGTPGRISKWAGVSGSSTYVLGDSNIFEDKYGQVGIGTTTPTSPLTVAGMIETTLGGYKFPDGTVQTTAFNPSQVVRSLNGLQGDLFLAAGTNITVTPSGGNTLTIAAPNALTAVAHNATLSGDGTAASPLGIANGGVGNAQLANNAVTAAKIASGNVVKSLNGLKDDVVLTAGSNITLTPNGNTLAIASTAAEPAQQAFQRSFLLPVPIDGNGSATHTLLVPAGKRLVIEYISIFVFGDGECQPMVVTTTVDGVVSEHYIQLPVENNGYGISIDKPVKIYADSTSMTFLIINRSGGSKDFRIGISGHLVDLP